MREVAGNSGPPPDLQRLLDRVQEAVPKGVSQVGVVDASQPRRLPGQLHQLVGVGVAARGVVKAGGEAEGPLLHTLPQHRPHILHLRAGGGPVVPPGRTDPQWGVADDVGDVNRDLVVEHGQVLGHRRPVSRQRRVAVQTRVHLYKGEEVLM